MPLKMACFKGIIPCIRSKGEASGRDGRAYSNVPDEPGVSCGGSAGRGSRHKGKLDRLVLTSRVEIGKLLDMDGMPPAAIDQLKEISRKLADAESELKKVRARGPGHEFFSKNVNDSEESRRFLLENYTQHDTQAAESSHMLRTLSPKRAQKRPSLVQSWKVYSPARGPSSALMRAVSQVGLGEPVDPSEALLDPEVQRLLSWTGTWEFDAVAFASLPDVSGKSLCILGAQFFETGGIFESLHQHGWISSDIDTFEQKAYNFLQQIDKLYKKDAIYHGVIHAVDVMGTVEYYMHLPLLLEVTHTLDHIMVLMAAAIHDVGHPGTNQAFHTKTMSKMALRYNDKSVLENYHSALAFETMQQDDCNWLALLLTDFRSSDSDTNSASINLQQYLRKGLITMVLATDMSQHATCISRLQEFSKDLDTTTMRSDQGLEKQQDFEKKLFLLEVALHAADISNPCKPQAQMLFWSQRCLNEFWAQGDEEQRLEVPISPLCDRATGMAEVPKGQLGFIQFVILPFYSRIVEIMPEAQETIDQLEKNKAFWKSKEQQKAKYEDIFKS